MGNKDVEYRRETSATVAHHKRPLGHKIRSFVILIGIWFYFLFYVCIPEARRDAGEYVMVSAGSGIVQGAGFIFIFFTMFGLRRTNILRIVALILLAIYVVGGLILAIGRGRQATWAWDGTANHEFGDKTYTRMYYIGRLMGEVAYVTAGLMIILPDLGILNDYEGK